MFFVYVITAMLLLVLLDVAAARWGVDSRDTLESPEWSHHQGFWI